MIYIRIRVLLVLTELKHLYVSTETFLFNISSQKFNQTVTRLHDVREQKLRNVIAGPKVNVGRLTNILKLCNSELQIVHPNFTQQATMNQLSYASCIDQDCWSGDQQ
jgi:hypothetical protein